MLTLANVNVGEEGRAARDVNVGCSSAMLNTHSATGAKSPEPTACIAHRYRQLLTLRLAANG